MFPLRMTLALLLSLGIASAFAQDPLAEESVQAQESARDLYARDSYRIDSLVCPFRDTIDYEPGDIECRLLEVPENREDPDSRFIELHFVKLNSRWGRDEEADDDGKEDDGLPPGKRDDPVIYLTGGPGARVNYYVGRFKDHGLLDHRDLYILEQRGIEDLLVACRVVSFHSL